jgi:hypothetical protein
MLKKLRIPALLSLALLFLFSISSFAPTPPPTLPDATPTPGRVKVTPIPLSAQEGKTDGIVLLSGLIVAIIIVPLLLYSRNWPKNAKSAAISPDTETS